MTRGAGVSESGASYEPSHWEMAKVHGEETTVYTMCGSQFGAKVVAALDATGTPYRIFEVSPMKLKQQTVAPHTVPQARWKGGQMLTDSADILEAIDRDGVAPFKLYPDSCGDAARALEQEIGSELNAFVIYFTWFRRRVQRTGVILETTRP